MGYPIFMDGLNGKSHLELADDWGYPIFMDGLNGKSHLELGVHLFEETTIYQPMQFLELRLYPDGPGWPSPNSASAPTDQLLLHAVRATTHHLSISRTSHRKGKCMEMLEWL